MEIAFDLVCIGVDRYKIYKCRSKQTQSSDKLLVIQKFATLVKRSDISIEQCAQGFRRINILKILA
jgi:hypothetical protein